MPAKYLINLNNFSPLSCYDNQIISSKDIAMPEKKTSSMLIRDIPMDVWERIDRLCRHKNMKRRDFVEQALLFFEGGETEVYSRKSEPIQPPDIDRLKRDIEDLKRDINKNKDKVHMMPESAVNLMKTYVDSENEAPASEKEKKKVLTTVFCWGLDDKGR
jgi:hypothetical protein